MLALPIDLSAKFVKGGEFYAFNSESVLIEGAETNWVSSSGARGLTSARIKLNGKEDKPANYKVTLSFTSTAGDRPKQRLFDIKLQGKVVARDVATVTTEDGTEKVTQLTFESIHVTDDIAIELIPKDATAGGVPTLTSLELLREGEQPIVN